MSVMVSRQLRRFAPLLRTHVVKNRVRSLSRYRLLQALLTDFWNPRAPVTLNKAVLKPFNLRRPQRVLHVTIRLNSSPLMSFRRLDQAHWPFDGRPTCANQLSRRRSPADLWLLRTAAHAPNNSLSVWCLRALERRRNPSGKLPPRVPRWLMSDNSH